MSLTSVHLELFFNGQPLSIGTGFVIGTKQGPFLATAKHNLTGREIDGKIKHTQGGLPNQVTLRNFFGPLATQVPLYDGGNDPSIDKPRYLIHTKNLVDVALLPLPASAAQHEINVMNHTLWRPTTHHVAIPLLRPADVCHVIGYPEGFSNELGGGSVLPIWKTGHLANDPQFKFNGHDKCLIDSTTRPGLSGAPVFVVSRAYDGSAAAHRLVGIYAGRISETSALGEVWSPICIHNILDAAYKNW